VAGWCAAKGLDVTSSRNPEADRVIAGKRVEIKFSTLWESGVYKFQQIRDQDYEYFFFRAKRKAKNRIYGILGRVAEKRTLTHERVDDIPLLIGLAQTLHLPEVLDRHLGHHGNHQGLRNGWLATVWLASILSESDHRTSSVEEWTWQHRQTLERLLGQPIRPAE
jgi:hypothetical protein